MAGTLKITESVSFSYLDSDWSKVKDDYEGAFAPQRNPGPTHPSGLGTMGAMSTAESTQQQSSQGLNIQIAATHSGIITRNNGFYLPDRMKRGAKSFTDDYPKPVLLHHEDHNDPVGRVIDSAYIDTSGLIQDKYRGKEITNKSGKVVGKITDKLIRDFVGSKMPFGQQVDVVRTLLRDSDMLEDNGYTGLGYIKILANITDPEAIQKLLDGRYITGSVGATTDKAVCSVCRTDWTDSGPCDHSPGGIYDDAKCFIIAGDLIYDEYSFVNVPADRHSRVLQLDCNGVKTDIETINDYKSRIYEASIMFPQYDSNIKEDKEMGDKAKTVADEKSDNNLEIKDATTSAAPEVENTDGDNQSVSDSVDETKVTDEETSDETKEVIADETTTEESIQDFVVRVLDSEVKLSNEENTKLYDFMWTEVLSAVKDGALPLNEEELKSVKLSDEKLNKLPKSSFCGPGRSFPVNDCAHIVAAKRLVDTIKMSDSVKEGMLKVIDRKAKLKDCNLSVAKDSTENKDALDHSRMLRMMLSVLDEDTYYTDNPVLDDDEKKMLQSVIKRMATLVGKDSFSIALQSEELGIKDNILLEEITSLEDNVVDLKDRLKATLKEHNLLFKDMEDLQDQLTSEISSSRTSKESHLKTLTALHDHKISEENNFAELSISDLNSEIDKTLKLVDMNKITDKLGDGLSRIPSEDIDNPNEINDNTDAKKVKITEAQVALIQQKYLQLRMTNQQAAENYRIQVRNNLGSLPLDLENIKGENK